MANTTGQSTAGNKANNKALQTGAQVAVAASPLAPLAPYIPMIMSMAGNFMSNRAEEQSRQAQADDLSGVNDKMDAFRTAWQNVQKGYQDSGEKQFMNEANTALPELQQARTDIANQGTEAQQQLSGQFLEMKTGS